jgi:hypothetical protein
MSRTPRATDSKDWIPVGTDQVLGSAYRAATSSGSPNSRSTSTASASSFGRPVRAAPFERVAQERVQLFGHVLRTLGWKVPRHFDDIPIDQVHVASPYLDYHNVIG